MKTAHVVRTLGIGLASAWLLTALPAAAFTGGTGGISTTGGTGGKGGTGGGGTGGLPAGCQCTVSGGAESNLGGVFGAAAIGACLWRLSRGRRSREQQ